MADHLHRGEGGCGGGQHCKVGELAGEQCEGVKTATDVGACLVLLRDGGGSALLIAA